MGLSVEASWIFAETGLAVPANALIRVLTSILKIDEAALISGEGAYTLQNYSATQPSAQADLATWTLASGDLSSYRGSIALGTPVDLGGAAYVRSVLADPYDIRVNSAGSMWSRLVTAGAFTATAIARQVQLHGFLL
jgi:hypothetical protein